MTWVVSINWTPAYLRNHFKWTLPRLVQPFTLETSTRPHVNDPFSSSFCGASRVVPVSVWSPCRWSIFLFLPKWLKGYSFSPLNIFNTKYFLRDVQSVKLKWHFQFSQSNFLSGQQGCCSGYLDFGWKGSWLYVTFLSFVLLGSHLPSYHFWAFIP